MTVTTQLLHPVYLIRVFCSPEHQQITAGQPAGLSVNTGQPPAGAHHCCLDWKGRGLPPTVQSQLRPSEWSTGQFPLAWEQD